MASSTVEVSTPAEGTSRWLVVGLLTVGVIIAYTSRINLSAAIPEIRKSIPLSPASIGILLSAFFWAYTLLQTPAGWVVDRFGIKWPYAAALFLWSTLSAATALVSSLRGLILVRVLLGVGEAFVTPASMGYIRKHFPEHQRGLPVGIFMSGTKYGPAIGAPVATYLVLGYGWRWMFILSGTVSLLWLIPWFLLVKKDGPLTATRQAKGNAASWYSLFSTPVMWGTCIGTFCYMYFVYFCMTWMPTFFNERYGLSLTASGWFTFISFGGMATVAILGGWAADRLIVRGHNPVTVRRLFTIAGFVLGCSEIFGALSGDSSMALFWAVFSLCGLGLATANYWALTQTLTPANAAGRVAGIQNTAANVAGVAAAWFTGILVEKTKHFNAPLMAIGFWLVIGICCYVFLVREKYALRQA
ncbi:MAG TPA: MFS transporter [Terracidiphilus sp.]|jgi:MFS family permease